MTNKIIGGILLIVGTSIGGGMLALPAVTAQAGFLPALLLMIASWFVMTLGAFWILEVNLWLPPGSNLISMAKATLGRAGQVVAWISYLLLLYCLLSAYIAGGGDVVQHLLANTRLHFNYNVSAILFLIVFASIVSKGIQSVDWVNRLLLFIKLIAYVLLIAMAASHVQFTLLDNVHFAYLTMAVMPVITSFGYAIIVPNLRSYLHDDVAKLRFIVGVGSLIPLVCYIIWEIATLGALSLNGEHGLATMASSGHPTSELMLAIGTLSHSHIVHSVSKVFTSLCVATSFLGVSLALCHFLRDGLKQKKDLQGNAIVYSIAYLPPLLLVLFFPNAFIMGLSYAGICCVVLLMLLPALMAWSGRYHKKIASGFKVQGGRGLIVLVVLVSIGLIVFDAIS